MFWTWRKIDRKGNVVFPKNLTFWGDRNPRIYWGRADCIKDAQDWSYYECEVVDLEQVAAERKRMARESRVKA